MPVSILRWTRRRRPIARAASSSSRTRSNEWTDTEMSWRITLAASDAITAPRIRMSPSTPAWRSSMASELSPTPIMSTPSSRSRRATRTAPWPYASALRTASTRV
jgi:hypothetical protein